MTLHSDPATPFDTATGWSRHLLQGDFLTGLVRGQFFLPKFREKGEKMGSYVFWSSTYVKLTALRR